MKNVVCRIRREFDVRKKPNGRNEELYILLSKKQRYKRATKMEGENFEQDSRAVIKKFLRIMFNMRYRGGFLKTKH